MSPSHLDDEQLSAHLDGEAGSEQAAHLEGCGPCQARLADLRAVAAAVGAPVAPAPEHHRQAAVRAALAAWGTERGRQLAPPRAALPPPPPPARRLPLPGWALAAAAAVLVVLLAVPLLAALRDGGGSDSPQVAQARREALRADNGGEQALADGGDLGEQSDEAVLAEAVRRGLPAAPTAAALPGAAAERSAPAPPGPSEAAIPAPPSTVSPPPAGQARPLARGAAAPPCTGAVRAEYGPRLGALVYSASLRWKGTPAVVLAYRVADPGQPGLDHLVFVTAREDCRLLVVQAF